MQPVQLSVFTKVGGPLTKVLRCNAEGVIQSDASQCTPSRGVVDTLTVTLDQLPDLFSQLNTAQAIATGVVVGEHTHHEVLPRKAYEEAGFEGPVTSLPQGNYTTRTLEAFHQEGPSLVMFDFDKDEANPHRFKNPQEFLAALASVAPELAKASYVRTYSTSTSLYDTKTHQCIRPADGWHIYMVIKDGSDLGRFGEALEQRLWLAGFGYCKVSNKNAAIHTRCIVDTAVFSPERLVFEAGAVVPTDQDFYQRLPKPEYHAGELEMFDTRLVPSLSDLERIDFENAQKMAKAKPEVQSMVTKVKAEMFEQVKAESLAKNLQLTDAALRQIVDNLERLVLTPWHVLKFMDGREAMVLTVWGAPHLYDGADLYDPLREDKGLGRCKLYANEESGVFNPVIHSFVEGGRTYVLRDSVQMLSRQSLDGITNALSAMCHETIAQNSRYMIPFPCSKKGVYLVKAEKGVGKTYVLSEMLKDDPGRLLVVTHRVSLTNSVALQFGATSYQDEDMTAAYKLRSQRRLAICYDSLYKLNQQYYSTLVIDEMTQLMRHIKAATVKERYTCLNVLKSMMAAADRVFLLDADWNAEFLRLLTDPLTGCLPRAPITLVVNKYLPAEQQKRQVRLLKNSKGKGDVAMLCQELTAYVKAGNGTFYASNSVADVQRKGYLVLKALGYTDGPIPREHFMTCINGRRVITITGENSGDPEVRAWLAEINENLRDDDVLLASPSLGTGVSINAVDGKPKFAKVFAQFNKMAGNISRDCSQHMARVRECTDITMVVLDNKQLATTQPQVVIDIEVLGKLRMMDARNGAHHGLNFNHRTRAYEFADSGWASWMGYLTALENIDRNDFEEHLLEALQLEGYTVTHSQLGILESWVPTAMANASSELKELEMELRRKAPIIGDDEKTKLEEKRTPTTHEKRMLHKRQTADLFGIKNEDELNTMITASEDYQSKARFSLILAANPQQLLILDLANRLDRKRQHISKTAYYETYRLGLEYLGLFNIRLDKRGLPDAYGDEVTMAMLEQAYSWLVFHSEQAKILFGQSVPETLDPTVRCRIALNVLMKFGFKGKLVSKRVKIEGQSGSFVRKIRLWDREAIEVLRKRLRLARDGSTSTMLKPLVGIPSSLVEYVANAAAGFPEKVPVAHSYISGLPDKEREYVAEFVSRFARPQRATA